MYNFSYILLIITGLILAIWLVTYFIQLAKSDGRPNYVRPPIEYLKIGDSVIIKTGKFTGFTGVIVVMIHQGTNEYKDNYKYSISLNEYKVHQIHHSIHCNRDEIETPTENRKRKIKEVISNT
jgi:hypothetical protein